MSVAVLEIERAADGVWQGELHDVRGAEDIETFASLEGFISARALVRIGGRTQELDVYERDGLAFVRLDQLATG